MRVLVTTGTDNIGADLCRVLVGAPGVDEESVFADVSMGERENLDGTGAVSFEEGSALETGALGYAVDEIDAVVYMATRSSAPRSLADARATHEVNATGRLNVLGAGEVVSVTCVVIVRVWSEPGTPRRRRSSPPYRSCRYCASKLAAEQYPLA